MTFVTVLAIVAGAFAFKIKKGAYCITTDLSSTTCTTYLSNKKIGSIATDVKCYIAWDGDGAACTAANNTQCTSICKLLIN